MDTDSLRMSNNEFHKYVHPKLISRLFLLVNTVSRPPGCRYGGENKVDDQQIPFI